MDHGVVVSKINKLGYEQKKHSSSWQGEATSNEPALLQQMMSPLFCCLSGGGRADTKNQSHPIWVIGYVVTLAGNVLTTCDHLIMASSYGILVQNGV